MRYKICENILSTILPVEARRLPRESPSPSKNKLLGIRNNMYILVKKVIKFYQNKKKISYTYNIKLRQTSPEPRCQDGTSLPFKKY